MGKKGAYQGGIRTLEDLRIRCRMEGDCWIWGMGLSHGRPSVCITVDGKKKAVNGKRAALRLAGTYERGGCYATAADCCPNPQLCVNPAHVKQTHPTHIRRKQNKRPELVAAWRRNGMQRRHYVSKLTPEQVLAIYAAKGTKKAPEVAAEFGCNKSNVYLIWARKTWRDVLGVPVNSVFSLAA